MKLTNKSGFFSDCNVPGADGLVRCTLFLLLTFRKLNSFLSFFNSRFKVKTTHNRVHPKVVVVLMSCPSMFVFLKIQLEIIFLFSLSGSIIY